MGNDVLPSTVNHVSHDILKHILYLILNLISLMSHTLFWWKKKCI